MKENDPSSVLLFLVGTKKDLSVGGTDQRLLRLKEFKCEVHEPIGPSPEPFMYLMFFYHGHGLWCRKGSNVLCLAAVTNQ